MSDFSCCATSRASNKEPRVRQASYSFEPESWMALVTSATSERRHIKRRRVPWKQPLWQASGRCLVLVWEPQGAPKFSNCICLCLPAKSWSGNLRLCPQALRPYWLLSTRRLCKSAGKELFRQGISGRNLPRLAPHCYAAVPCRPAWSRAHQIPR